MDVVTSIIAIAVLIALLVFIRRNARQDNVRPDERRKVQASKSSRFHAVSLKFSGDACQAAKDMYGRRFLSGAAPRIPLPECDALECRCRFVHHEDRRTGKDRRNPWGQGLRASGTGKFAKEQRKGRERRSDDDEMF